MKYNNINTHNIILTLTMRCIHSLELIYFIAESLYPFHVIFSFSWFPSPRLTHFYSCFLCIWLYSDSTFKWYHSIIIFLCLIYVIQYNPFKVHPCSCKIRFPSFPWLKNIPMCICVHVCVYVCVCMYLISSLSIHL